MAGLDGRDLELDSLLVDLEHRVTRWVARGHLVMTYRKVSLNSFQWFSLIGFFVKSSIFCELLCFQWEQSDCGWDKKTLHNNNNNITSSAKVNHHHNLKWLKNNQQQNLQQRRRRKTKPKNPDCNCQTGPQNCPLNGKCQKEKNVVYVGKVLRLDNFEEKRYTGVHEGPFKGRIYGHNTDINNRHHTGTGLSRVSSLIYFLVLFDF